MMPLKKILNCLDMPDVLDIDICLNTQFSVLLQLIHLL
jgi:hypothetical protein